MKSVCRVVAVALVLSAVLGGALEAKPSPKQQKPMSLNDRIFLLIDYGADLTALARNCHLATASGIKLDVLTTLTEHLTPASMIDAERNFDVEMERMGDQSPCDMSFLTRTAAEYKKIRSTFSN